MWPSSGASRAWPADGRGASGGARSAHSRARHDIRPASPSSRRCIVKARYVPIRAGGAQAARQHLAYIERDGVEQDGSKGRLFDGSGDVECETFAAPIAGEKRQFRFIISHDDGNELDLRDYTSRLMQRMEKDLGRGLRWAAVCHYNTDPTRTFTSSSAASTVAAPRSGSIAALQRTSGTSRLRAQELATLELGPRNEFDVSRQLTNEVAQERLTTIESAVGRAGFASWNHRRSGDRRGTAEALLAIPHAVAHWLNLNAARGWISPRSWRVTKVGRDPQTLRGWRHHQAHAPRPQGRATPSQARACSP